MSGSHGCNFPYKLCTWYVCSNYSSAALEACILLFLLSSALILSFSLHFPDIESVFLVYHYFKDCVLVITQIFVDKGETCGNEVKCCWFLSPSKINEKYHENVFPIQKANFFFLKKAPLGDVRDCSRLSRAMCWERTAGEWGCPWVCCLKWFYLCGTLEVISPCCCC